MKQNYDVAAFFWPAWTLAEPRARIFWPEGYGEWETLREAKAQYPGHPWPRKPLWGYVNEADPYVMEMEIEAAVDHGVNVFIYDWYWFDNRPIWNQCLEQGFLKARNRNKMKYYIMWANHDIDYAADRRISTLDYSTKLWLGKVTPDQFEVIADEWFNKYFHTPEYYQIDGKPVIAIYDLGNLYASFGGKEGAIRVMQALNDRAVREGFAGIHFQYIKTVGNNRRFRNSEGSIRAEIPDHEYIKGLPFASMAHYVYVHFISNINRDYSELMNDVRTEWEHVVQHYDIPYFPSVSVGWDHTARYSTHTWNVALDSSPEKFKAALQDAKALADRTGNKMIVINSWNEWTEGSYLEPDDLTGYGYLDAVKAVFCKD